MYGGDLTNSDLEVLVALSLLVHIFKMWLSEGGKEAYSMGPSSITEPTATPPC